jgi:tetratricopeptide (TPR) repeat protein
MTIHKAALAITLLLGTATPALSQDYGQPAPPPPRMDPPRLDTPPPAPATAQPAQPGRNYNLTRQERTAFQPVLAAVTASDWATATTALAAVTPTSNDGKYLVGQIRLRIGISTQNRAFQSQAIDEMIASGGALPTEMRALYENQLEFATAAGDTAKAARAMAALDAMNPNDPNRFIRQARIAAATDAPGALRLYRQAIELQTRNNQPIPVEWRQHMVQIAARNNLPETMPLMREWLVAAPTPALWHDVLAIYADRNAPLKLDTFRLMRAAGVMTSERDFIELSQAANEVRAFGEVKAVLEEGLRRNLITTNAAYARERIELANRRATDDRSSLAEGRRTALAGSDAAAALVMGDAYYGYGEYAPAAELYRAALQKGADAGTANIRLGAALALAGQRAQAEAAFRAVTGPRAELAQLWLLWLSTRPQ